MLPMTGAGAADLAPVIAEIQAARRAPSVALKGACGRKLTDAVRAFLHLRRPHVRRFVAPKHGESAMRIPALLILGTAAVFVFGCASKEEPAKQAVASVDAALGEVRPNAGKDAPQQLSAAEASLANLKRDLSNEKYKTVLLHAPDVNKEVGALKEMVVAKQTQVAAATREWEELSQDVPPMVKAIQVRVDNLTGTRLPREV